MEDDEDIFENNQVEFLAERNVWDRIGGADIGLGLGSAISLKRSGNTIEEIFKYIVRITINLINNLDIQNMVLTIPETIHMLNLVEKIPDFQYKNPHAFVLGYIVAIHSDYGSLKIDKDALELCFQINKEVEDSLFTKIENEDIVRYTRLCLINKIK